MIAIYMRVSTDKQDTSSQKHEIDQFLIKHNMSNVSWYVDEGISGKTTKRPAYQKMCADIRDGKVESVVMYRLDRLGRDAITTMRLLFDWMQQDISFYSVTQPILQLGKDNPFRITIISIFSELSQIERETIVTRIKSGLEAAKARGVKLGARDKHSNMIPTIKAMRATGKSVKEIVRETRIPQSTIYFLLRSQ